MPKQQPQPTAALSSFAPVTTAAYLALGALALWPIAASAAEENPAEKSNTVAVSVTVNEGEAVTLAIPITNPYDRGWRIKQIDLSCPCYELVYDDPLFAPNETRIFTLNAESFNASGQQNHRALIYASDPDLPFLEVKFNWIVKPRITVDRLPDGATRLDRPDDVRYRDVYLYQSDVTPASSGSLQRNILIKAGSGRAEDDPELTVSLPAEADMPIGPWGFSLKPLGNETFLLAARGVPTWVGEKGIINQELTLTTNDPAKPQLNLKFTSFVELDH